MGELCDQKSVQIKNLYTLYFVIHFSFIRRFHFSKFKINFFLKSKIRKLGRISNIGWDI